MTEYGKIYVYEYENLYQKFNFFYRHARNIAEQQTPEREERLENDRIR